jgi:hypothetical protein
VMLKIRQLKAAQDAEKAAAAEAVAAGAPAAQPKQSPGQIRIQKGAPPSPPPRACGRHLAAAAHLFCLLTLFLLPRQMWAT